MSNKVYFSSELFKFFRELKKNNKRLWFQANKDRYIKQVQEPFIDFIRDFDTPLRKISKYYAVDTRTMGGSLFRIYRDTRFAKDKTPFKTHAGAHFPHLHGGDEDVHSAGFYVHLEPGEVFFGAGMWRPDSKSAYKIRQRIGAKQAEWKKIKSIKSLEFYVEQEDKLKRPPRGFEPDHPLIEDLKLKSFLVSKTLREKDACSPGFLEKYVEFCRQAVPLMRFLTKAIGLPW